MTKFYPTAEYLKRQIEEKQKEISKMKREMHEAQIREFYWHVLDNLDTENQEFIDSPWEISFMGKSVELDNFAQSYNDFVQLLENYMDDEEIEYTREEGNQ